LYFRTQDLFGCRLHLVVALGGVSVGFEPTSTIADEQEAAQDMLMKHPERSYLGDKGDISALLAERNV
jgi:hypothetical protein